ncbi:MAG: acetyl-CoA C-acetyltransferase [Deinococcus sp.]|uniref:acetyl-CoA C-acetyltransferase n=1 Tax=Deinococcus sp. TaxID=47478 RepID=UPI0026DB12AB|nr:acetyl-CoA C-acetyltransferase [Deinococcus sp.]MDO4245267.1 acetyl-CoA C-acetyltransferase [Deinococcus sp.]
MSEKIVIVSAKRTPLGSFMGSLKDVSAVDLGITAAKAALDGVSDEVKGDVADVIVGCVLQAGQGMGVARQIGRGAGLPNSVPAQTINRLCGSGLQAVVSAIQGIRAGDGQVYLAGGTESMSRAPYLLPRAREGYRLGHGELLDSILADGLTDVFGKYHMGMTAENLAEKYSISREEQDAFALESQNRAAAALEGGFFADEVVPVEVPSRKRPVSFDKDEYPRATTAEALAKLKPAFKRDGGTVTAGNASGINDGAAMLLVATESYAQERGLPILAEIKGYANVGVDPEIMGIGPAYAVPLALKKAGLSVSDVDLFELNEAFAAQSIAVLRDLGTQGSEVDPAKVNITGGAIALGHPIGASGARVLTTLVHGLRRTGKETGVASLCIGGGMGIALVLQAR